MKKLKYVPLLLIGSLYAQNQSGTHDSLKTHQIREVIVIGTGKISAQEAKPLGSIDEYLDKSGRVDLVRRGAYAWEPLINGMPTERTLVTIDGMRVFGACTDKMDPITSYLEISNLKQATVSSGQEGACHGNTIGGSIDLKRNTTGFGQRRWNHQINTGFESVNLQKIFGAGTKYKNENFYTDINFMLRDAENYRAGGGTEVPYSQFRKMNVSGVSGVKLADNQLLEGSVIYDKATDVGYPALPMDVSLAEALITSLKYQVLPESELLKSWETKVYYNTITHRMDDTKRPDVVIHMDMPGQSTTFGYYSHLKADLNRHQLLLNLNGYYNKSHAEMTMYPTDVSEKPMFMLTWPDVKTLSQAVYVEDEIEMGDTSALKLSGSVTAHQNTVDSEFGLSSLRIFYPEMAAKKTRFLTSLAANYTLDRGAWQAGFGAAYGNRAPSVSEGYGFYLFNSFERYDYIGNPHLKNESSMEANAFIGVKKPRYNAKLSSSYFYISNYIVGRVLPGVVPMTIGARGVKAYTALPSATIVNATFSSEINIAAPLTWSAQFTYTRGTEEDGSFLPFMSPFSYRSALRYVQNQFSAEVSVAGNAAHRDFAAAYGEQPTPAYAVANANAGYSFPAGKTKITAKAGIENLFDARYTTYSDWNQIPRPGRNLFLNLNFDF